MNFITSFKCVNLKGMCTVCSGRSLIELDLMNENGSLCNTDNQQVEQYRRMDDGMGQSIISALFSLADVPTQTLMPTKEALFLEHLMQNSKRNGSHRHQCQEKPLKRLRRHV